ncbi:MAG: response regulator transcription factor [Pseudomonadales bacterium]|nr:response regulator transcription factor [Pseudomonadales bacterium]
MLKIILAEDHAIFRDCLRLLIESKTTHEIVAEVETVPELKKAAVKYKPDILIFDYKMPGGDTFAVAQYLKKRYPEISIICLTASDSPLVLQKLAASKIDGLLRKEGSANELLDAISQVRSGAKYISPLVQPYLQHSAVALTQRELQVLAMIADGMKRGDIATQLGLSPETIKSHRRNLMSKLEVNTVAALIAKAQVLKLID